MANQESEDLQLRREEIDILNSIYIDELLISNNKSGIAECIEIVLHPATAGQAHQQYVCLTLLLHIPKSYPNVEPRISIKNPRGISDEFVNSLKRSLEAHATENLGHQVLFSLIQHANDSLTYNNTPSCDCAVCLTGFQDEDAFTKTECYHYFHISCLERYINVCTNDHEKELAEIQVTGGIPQQTQKKLQIVCPVCREPISYQSESENKNIQMKPVEDDAFVPDKSMRRWQEKMKKLYKKQEEQGGIIDVEAESNRFLLDISTTVSAPLSTPEDDKNSTASKSEHYNELGNLKSRRENKYGNRSYRYGERRQSNKDRNEFTAYRRKEGNVNSNNDACEQVIIDTKTELKSNDESDGENVIGSNKSPVKAETDNENLPQNLPDLKKLEKEYKEDNLDKKDDQLNDNGSEKEIDSSDKVNTNLTQITFCDTGRKDNTIGWKQLDRENENESTQKDKKQNEQKDDVPDKRKSTNCTNDQKRGERNNYRTGEKKPGHWRNKDDYSNDKRTHQRHTCGATGGNERHGSASSDTTRNQRYRFYCATSEHQRPRSGGAMTENQRQYRSSVSRPTTAPQRNKSSTATAENQRQYRSGVSRPTTAPQRNKSSSATTENQRQRSGAITAGGNISESSEKKSDRLPEKISDSNNDIDEKGKCNKTLNIASNQTSRQEEIDEPNQTRQRESKQIKKDGQLYSAHQSYKNQRHYPKKYPDKTKEKRDFKDSAAAKSSIRQEKTKLCNSELRTKDHSSEPACGKKLTTVPKGSSPFTNPTTAPPGFKSKRPILPPPGF